MTQSAPFPRFSASSCSKIQYYLLLLIVAYAKKPTFSSDFKVLGPCLLWIKWKMNLLNEVVRVVSYSWTQWLLCTFSYSELTLLIVTSVLARRKCSWADSRRSDFSSSEKKPDFWITSKFCWYVKQRCELGVLMEMCGNSLLHRS